MRANISGGAKQLGIVVIKQVPINTASVLDWSMEVLYDFLKYPVAPSKDATLLYPTPVTKIQIQT